MSFTNDLLEGVAQHLQDAGVAQWQPSEKYPTGQVGIWMVGLPDTPDRGLALAFYSVEDTLYGHGIQGIQVRCRGTQDPRVVQVLADAVFDALHGARALDLVSGVHVAEAWRQSHAPIGSDSAGRWETSSNFYLLTPRQHANID